MSVFKAGMIGSLVLAGWFTGVAGAVNIEMVPVGNAGNTADTRHTASRGSVGYDYSIGKYEVTSTQYTEFLNKVAGIDTYRLYNTRMAGTIERYAGSGTAGDPYQYRVISGCENRPVNNASWGDATRFANWMANGQPSGAEDLTTTEDGSYYVNGATTNAELQAVTRKAGAAWVIPSLDEWYKAAYHKNDGITGNYWEYPTQSDTVDTTMANYDHSSPGTKNVGSYAYASAYGTYDQAGNVTEWNELLHSAARGVAGGAYTFTSMWLSASVAASPSHSNPLDEGWGFRVALVPEPASLVLLTLGGLVFCRRRKGH